MNAPAPVRARTVNAWTRGYPSLLAVGPWLLAPALVAALLIPALAAPFLALLVAFAAAAVSDHRRAATDATAAARGATRGRLSRLATIWRAAFVRGVTQGLGSTGLRAYLTGGSRSLITRARHVFPVFTAFGIGWRAAATAVKTQVAELASVGEIDARELLKAWRARCASTGWTVAWLLAAVILAVPSLL